MIYKKIMLTLLVIAIVALLILILIVEHTLCVRLGLPIIADWIVGIESGIMMFFLITDLKNN